jgi:hypothetical protein
MGIPAGLSNFTKNSKNKMQYEGVLTKMETEAGSPIRYYLVIGGNFLYMNQLLGKEMSIDFLGFQCLNCGKKKKVYRQGHCYDCFYASPSVGDWIMRPELSKAHLGIADRDLDYETRVQLQPHIVYLALATEVKVGVTRKTQIPTRWIDQGAASAIAVAEVPNRYLAGIAEVALKEHFTDKTNWRRMLTSEMVEADLIAEKNRLHDLVPEEVRPYFLHDNDEVHSMEYPVTAYPQQINSLNLDKEPHFTGKLSGIRGQYLVFEDGTVFNVRGHEGYVVRITI